MQLLELYSSHIQLYLTPSQIQTLKILIWLLTVHKTVKIERLAACFPLPIKYESRRKHLQRFLTLSALSLPLFWFPIIQLIIQQEFREGNRLIITLDRTQWKNNNVLVIAVIYKKRAIPIYWQVLNKRGSSNLSEQQAIIKPVLRLLKKYELVILGDREFHGVELSYWLKNQNKKSPNQIYFIFRQKQGTHFKKHKGKAQKLSRLGIAPGTKVFLSNINITKKKGFGRFNLAAYWKRKYKNKLEKADATPRRRQAQGNAHQAEPWYLLTNLNNFEEVITIYRKRMGIEAMFKDCKTGGYNLEGSRANAQRLTNLILLIALAYTASVIKGKSIKSSGFQKYITRLTETQRKSRRHSNFWVGLYGDLWIIAWEFLGDIVREMMHYHRHKLPSYQSGLKVMSLLQMA